MNMKERLEKIDKHFENLSIEEFEEQLIKAGIENCPDKNITNVGWTDSHQSYYSAGDEAEAYCIDCEKYLNDDWNYCPNCGVKLEWGEFK